MPIAKPKTPYDDFPLFPHLNGCWAKKIRGKMHYFGGWADPDAAIQKYLDERDDLQAGRTPRKVSDTGVAVKQVVNQFLAAKETTRADAGHQQLGACNFISSFTR